jgi:hypothetical protein
MKLVMASTERRNCGAIPVANADSGALFEKAACHRKAYANGTGCDDNALVLKERG